jgi:hypothetical protein
MDPAARSLIAAVHQAGRPFVLAVTGGGASAAGLLLSVPGGSRSVIEVVVPYAEHALGHFLGHKPASFCSVATSREMAIRAEERARWLVPGQPVLGVGCSASLRSDRPKRGDHRFHIAIHNGLHTGTWSLTLTKEARDREGEEDVLDRVLLNALAETINISERVPVPLLPGEEVVVESVARADALAAFLTGRAHAVCIDTDGRTRTDAPLPGVLLPGSFNPLHEGHCTMLRVGALLTKRPAAFELTVDNAEKGRVANEEVRRRVAQFAWRGPLWLTNAPTFTQKARLFPGVVFVVGADTAERIVQPRFYRGSAEDMNEALGEIRARGCRFLVAGRCDSQGHFVGLDDLAIPAAHRDLFEGIPESRFHLDLSSTELRAGATG